MQENSAVTPPSNFIDYRRVEINLISDLHRLHAVATKLEMDAAVIQLIENALNRNKEHKFSIGVVGEFKRGKSTFINALLGKEILPADILPCSATLNRIVYGITPEVEIVYKATNGHPARVEHIRIDQLIDYVTKLTPESEQTAATIQEAIIHYPVAYCQNNVEVIDTPGLNDDANMTEVTLSVLPEVSAAILVIMPEAPFGGYEADFLNNELLLKDMGRVIFVVTAIDRVRRPSDRDRILKVIEDRIQISVERRLLERFGSQDTPEYQIYRKQIGKPRVFGLSGYQALVAHEEGDRKLMEESGFPAFEAALEKFVTETRGAVELQVLANRIVGTSGEVLKKISMGLGALQMDDADFVRAYDSAVNQLEALRRRRSEEIRQIDEATRKTKDRVRPLVNQVVSEMLQAAEMAIDQTEIKPSDIKDKQFREDLSKQVAAAVRIAGKKQGERIQYEVESDMMNEIRRLGDFAAEVNQVLRDIELSFTEVFQDQKQNTLAGNAAAILIGGIFQPFLGGALAGYQEAGGRGAAVGAAGAAGALLAGSVAVVALSLPLTWPAFFIIGAASALAGKFVARAAFAGKRVEDFRRDYKRQVAEQIESQVLNQRLDTSVYDQISLVFNALKTRFVADLDASIDQTQHTLDQLRSQKARHETLSEQVRKEHGELLIEVEKIRGRAEALSGQLVEFAHI